MGDYTRVFTAGGAMAHLLDYHQSPNSSSAEALCGRSAWPSLWHGTGSQYEEERAIDLHTCPVCDNIREQRIKGVSTR